MISASDGGVLFEAVETPETLLSVADTEPEVVSPSDFNAPDVAVLSVVVISIVPMFVPAGRPALCATARSVWPPGGTTPLAGVTESQGTVGVAVKLCQACSAAMLSVYWTSVGSDIMAEPSGKVGQPAGG